MIYPSIDEITKGAYNRYTLVIAAAKCARKVTEENLENKDQDKDVPAEKAVKTAIKRLYSGEYVITETPEDVDVKLAEEERRQREAEAAREAAEANTLKISNFVLDETEEDEEEEEEVDELREEEEESEEESEPEDPEISDRDYE